jgi:hypothetical protein
MILLGGGSYGNGAESFSRDLGFKKESMETLLQPMGGNDSLIFQVILNHPKSVGELKLSDKNPFSKPLLDPHYLEDGRDVKALVEGTGILYRVT